MKINFSLKILNYLVNRKEIRINTRNFMGQTPLFIAVKSGQLEFAKILLEKGANVNLPDNEDVTPLHRSVQYPSLAHLLITNGANVNVMDYSDDSPLHDAVAEQCLETVCMLLYYGADGNALGGNNLTPFMKALITENFEIQDALFEYVDDYMVTSLDENSTLTLALTHDNSYVEEIIKRGAEVNVASYKACINIPNPANFKLVWSCLTADHAEDVEVHLLPLYYQLDKDYLESYIDIIIEHSNTSLLIILAEKMESNDFAYLIEQCASNDFLTHDQITKLTLLLLEYGFQIGSGVIVEVFMNMGYCELFRILLYMTYIEDWGRYVITPRLIFDIHSNIRTRCDEIAQEGYILLNRRKFREDVLKSLSYWGYHILLDIVLNQFGDEFKDCIDQLPKVPSLLELARDETRKNIVTKFKMQNTCQYYTYLNCLDLSIIYKKILMFERKIY